ncbi:hypothetical protein, partial [Mesorhizobium sp.]|uniref:hypothetical protein n=1 Tax=Mesorhizobium sp. TaxID=1871066 RepID=UPI0035678261
KGAAGNGQKSRGSEDDLFHFLVLQYLLFAVRLAACLFSNSRRSDRPDVGRRLRLFQSRSCFEQPRVRRLNLPNWFPAGFFYEVFSGI